MQTIQIAKTAQVIIESPKQFGITSQACIQRESRFTFDGFLARPYTTSYFPTN